MPSPAALYSKLHSKPTPTLLLDEVDAIFNQKGDSTEAVRGVLDAGNRRGGTVSRVNMRGGKSRRVEEFNVYGPKALAGIRSLPETLYSRSIVIPLRRKTPDEEVKPFRHALIRERVEDLRARLATITVSEEWVRSFDAYELEGLSDRQIEGWQPLFALAGQGKWLNLATDAAQRLSQEQHDNDDTSLEALLLEHIRDAFGESNHIRTSTLLDTLRARDDGPWAEWFDENWDPFNNKSASKLARVLRPYGVKPRRPRFENGEQAAGYIRDDFAQAWGRWT
jgi:hypothetical protein